MAKLNPQQAMLAAAPLPAALYDAAGRLLWANRLYRDAIAPAQEAPSTEHAGPHAHREGGPTPDAVAQTLESGEPAICELDADHPFRAARLGVRAWSRAAAFWDAEQNLAGAIEYLSADELRPTPDASRPAGVPSRTPASPADDMLSPPDLSLLRYILRHDPNAIAVYDRDLRYIAVSERYLHDYAVQEQDILGRHHYEVFPEIPPRWRAIHQRVLGGEILRSEDDSFERPDGSITHNRWECRPWYAPDGAIGGMITYTEVTTERKEAEQRLATSRETLRRVIDLVPHMIYAKDAQGRFLLANEEIARGHGTTPEAMLGKTTRELLGWPADRNDPYVQDDLAVLRAQQKRVISQESFCYPDGTVHHFQTTKIPFRFNNPPIEAVLGVSNDITEYHNAVASLRESEARFRSYIATAPYGVFVTDRTGRYIEVNQASCRISGYSREELLRMSVPDLIPPESRETAHQHFQRVIETGQSIGAVPYRHKSGQVRFWNVSAVRVSDDRYLGFVEDVTERKRTAEALRESEETLRGIFATIRSGLILVDNRGLIRFANPRMAELFACPLDALLGSRYVDLVEPTVSAAAEENMQRLIDGDVENVLIHRHYRRRDGSTFVGELAGSRLLHDDGSLRGLVGIITDITERLEAEAQRERIEAQFHEMQHIESLGRLAGGVAHDFNNTLGVIIGYTEMGLEREDVSEEFRQDLREVLAAAKRSRDITRQLLAFARKEPIAPTILDLNASVSDMLSVLRRLIGEDIELRWRPSPDALPVLMDRAQLDQTLANLCINARDAITGVGRITIETGSRVADAAFRDRHVGAPPGAYAVLAVRDDGRGIDPDTMEKIFEPFFTTKGVGEGTGLGLATVHGIVKQNDGFIDVVSEPGRGSTFTIFLPQRAEAIPGPAPPDDAASEPGGGETLLVVDDEAAILGLARRVLEQQGYRVLTAKDPHAALQLADSQSSRIDLLISDVVMPGMNGRQLAERLQASHPGLKCLYMSGYTADIIVQRAGLAEGQLLLQKPFSNQDLTARVRTVLDAAA